MFVRSGVKYLALNNQQPFYVQGALQYKGHPIHGRTIQGRRTIHDQYRFPCFNTAQVIISIISTCIVVPPVQVS